MKHRLFATAALIGLSIAMPAFADGKCGDGGRNRVFEFSKNELVVTWAIPVPKNAKVTLTNGSIFDMASRDIGPDVPSGFPEKYKSDLKRVEVFNPTMAWSVGQLLESEKHFGIEMEQVATQIFDKYVRSQHDFVMMLVQHPPVAVPPSSFSSCSVVLQRGVIEYNDGVETLSLRSYFHSADESGHAVNFVPQGAVQITFESPEIWFPLSLTKLIKEPASYVVLDILTPNAVKTGALGQQFHAEATGKEIKVDNRQLNATRVTAKLESGKDLEDFRLKP
jgi:hypothetical protein